MKTKEENEADALRIIKQLTDDPGEGLYPPDIALDTQPPHRSGYAATRHQIALIWREHAEAVLPVGEWIRLAFQAGLKAGTEGKLDMLTIVVGTDNEQTSAVVRAVAGDEAPELSLEVPLDARGRTGSHVVVFPEAEMHPSAHARLGDLVVAWVKLGVDLVLWTHSRLLFMRLCRRVAEHALAHDAVRLLWCGEEGPVGCTFDANGLLRPAHAPDSPMPSMFGEKEMAEELGAIKQAVMLAQHGDKPLKELMRRDIQIGPDPGSAPTERPAAPDSSAEAPAGHDHGDAP